MFTKYMLLAAISLTSTAMAMEETLDVKAFSTHLCNSTEHGIAKPLDLHSLNTTSIEINDYYAAMQKEKLNLHQLFSFDTGFPSDDRVHDLAHILLSTEEKINEFRGLPQDTQIKTAVSFSHIAQSIESGAYTFDQTAFEQQCAQLRSGAISPDTIKSFYVKAEEKSEEESKDA